MPGKSQPFIINLLGCLSHSPPDTPETADPTPHHRRITMICFYPDGYYLIGSTNPTPILKDSVQCIYKFVYNRFHHGQ